MLKNNPNFQKQQPMPQKIVIFGGGIGGLTAAHFLSKLKDKYEIHIYEKKSHIGGLARSSRDRDGCAIEYCWRVFFDFYHNIFGVLNDIPLKEGGSALDNLIPYKHENVLEEDLKLRNTIPALYNIFYGFTSCDNRLDSLDEMSWWDALSTTSDSNLFREVGGWLGMDRYKGSYKSVIKVGMEMQILRNHILENYEDWITNKPTSEAWFDPWRDYLESQGVIFHMNSPLIGMEIDDDGVTISKAVISKETGVYNPEDVTADQYVLSLPVEALSRLISQTPALNRGGLQNIKKLESECLHIQLSFQLYFDRPVFLGKNDKNAFLVVDSPWDIIVLSYDRAYQNSLENTISASAATSDFSEGSDSKNQSAARDSTKICNKLPLVKGAWSVAACTAYIPGLIYKKPMSECTYDEIIVELWAQLSASKKLRELIASGNDFELKKDMIVKWSEMWPTYTSKNGVLRTTEPKFTNNRGSWKLRPSFKTHIPNLYISTAYIQETIDIFSMEAAAIAGKRVARAIDPSVDAPFEIKRPELFKPFRKVDEVMHSHNLPNINVWLILFVILSLLVFILYFIFLR